MSMLDAASVRAWDNVKELSLLAEIQKQPNFCIKREHDGPWQVRWDISGDFVIDKDLIVAITKALDKAGKK